MKILIQFIVVSFSILAAVTVHAQSLVSLEKSYYNDSGYKNIAFFCVSGGSSHYNWVLSIIDELGSRGHNSFFITTDSDMRFGRPFSHIKTVSAGESVKIPKTTATGAARLLSSYPTSFFSRSLLFANQNFERDFLFTKKFFLENKVDVALCDHWGYACMDAAKAAGIPFIVTGAIDLSEDSAAPYVNNMISTIYDQETEHQSFFERFKNKFINQLLDAYYMYSFDKDYHAKKLSVGISSSQLQHYTAPWKGSLKLINAIHGYVAPRPTGSLVELVGPILPKQYTPLTHDLKSYLDSHQRVAYVAFGQAATPSQSEIELILTSLLENIEMGALDGLIWAAVHAVDYFPATIHTSSGTIYQVQDFFDVKSNSAVSDHVRIVQWAPQTAILMHPSTIVFVSHGGLGSWYESMYTGTRMIMFPFFSDQPGNALIIERSFLGGILNYDSTPQQAKELVRKIVLDEHGEIVKSVRKYQAMTQIHAEHNVVRAADLVEEVVYTHTNGRLLHRESADCRISYIKSSNIDLYAALIVFLSSCCYGALLVVQYVVSLIKKSTLKIKIA